MRTSFATDRAMRFDWFRQPGKRRLILGTLAAILAVLAVFPYRYRAIVKLAPPESNVQSLSAVLGGLGGTYSTLLSNQPTEVNLAVSRSYDVLRDTALRLRLIDAKTPPADVARSIVKLERQIDVRALRGGLLQIETRSTDPDTALSMVDAISAALQRRLSALSSEQIAYKRRILTNRLQDAESQVRTAQTELTRFRQLNRLPAPQEQLSQSVLTLNTLEGSLRAKEAELAIEQRFSGPENYNVKRLQGEIAIARRQLAEERSRQQDDSFPTSAASLAEVTTRYADLTRNLTIAQSLYQSYVRYLEGSSVEELTAQYNLERLESSHLDPDWQINTVPFGLCILIVLIALAAEFYVMGPPPGAALAARD